MDMLKSAGYIIGVLSVLIVAHEWGHFIVAKLCKMRVDDFSLFFGPKLFSLGKRNGTEYNIRSIPLGGFVKIAGMEPEDTTPGYPIFDPATQTEPAFNWERYNKLLVGLDTTRLEKLDYSHISDRIAIAASDAIGKDHRLTASGREHLESLMLSTGISGDENRFLSAILDAAEARPDPSWYSQKPLWQRASVIFAGPFMSLFFGYALFCGMGFTTGLPDADNKHMAIGSVSENRPAEKAGIKPGDWIVAVNGKPTNADEAFAALRNSVELGSTPRPTPVTIKLMRGSAPYEVTLTPYLDKGPRVDMRGNVIKGKNGKPELGPVSLIGITMESVWTRYGFVASIKRGSSIIYEEVTGTLSSIFSRNVRNNVGGIITIGSVINENRKQGPNHVLFTAAVLSVSLGILNLFPIPVLDGGHLMLLTWEGVRRRRLTNREVYNAQVVGLVIIGMLFVFVMYNDVLRLFKRQ